MPKAPRHIIICSRYLHYGPRLPFSYLTIMVLNYYTCAPSKKQDKKKEGTKRDRIAKGCVDKENDEAEEEDIKTKVDFKK